MTMDKLLKILGICITAAILVMVLMFLIVSGKISFKKGDKANKSIEKNMVDSTTNIENKQINKIVQQWSTARIFQPTQSNDTGEVAEVDLRIPGTYRKDKNSVYHVVKDKGNTVLPEKILFENVTYTKTEEIKPEKVKTRIKINIRVYAEDMHHWNGEAWEDKVKYRKNTDKTIIDVIINNVKNDKLSESIREQILTGKDGVMLTDAEINLGGITEVPIVVSFKRLSDGIEGKKLYPDYDRYISKKQPEDISKGDKVTCEYYIPYTYDNGGTEQNLVGIYSK